MLLGPERVESRAYSGPSFSIGDPALAEFFGMGGQTLAGVPVNESSSLGLTSVFRAVSIIAGTIGGLPLRSYRTDSDGQRQRVPTFLDNPSGPGGPYTQFEWLELVMVCLLLHGNAFLQHIYNGGGAIVGLLPLPPSAVTVRPIQTGEELANYGGPDGTYRKWFEIQLADGSRRELTCAELTHIPALGTDGVRGLSPIEVHRQALGTALAGDRAAARLFGSGLLLGGLVTGDDSLSREDAEEAVAQLRAKMAGSDHAGDILFLNAQLKFQP
jgi:HK97 family phage portal protein